MRFIGSVSQWRDSNSPHLYHFHNLGTVRGSFVYRVNRS